MRILFTKKISGDFAEYLLNAYEGIGNKRLENAA
jgi:hypothetical protein